MQQAVPAEAYQANDCGGAAAVLLGRNVPGVRRLQLMIMQLQCWFSSTRIRNPQSHWVNDSASARFGSIGRTDPSWKKRLK